jgi:glycosyltransferase involved in cell wall biosynthesis
MRLASAKTAGGPWESRRWLGVAASTARRDAIDGRASAARSHGWYRHGHDPVVLADSRRWLLSTRPLLSREFDRMAPLKLLLTVHHFPPNFIGGVELISLRTARWMKDHGFDVEVISVEEVGAGNSGTWSVKEEDFEGIHTLRLSLPRFERYTQESYRHHGIGEWFGEFLERSEPDVVHVQSSYLLSGVMIEVAKSRSIPTVVSLHDYWYLCPRINLTHPNGSNCSGPAPEKCQWCLMTEKRRYRWLDAVTLGGAGTAYMTVAGALGPRGYRTDGGGRMNIDQRNKYLLKQLNAADAIVTQSHFLRDLMVDNGLSPELTKLIPCGVDVARQTDPGLEQDAAAFRIGYLGNIFPAKGVHLLITAFKSLPNPGDPPLELHIHGDHRRFPSYQRRIESLIDGDPRIHLHGRYDNAEIGAIFGSLDVLVVPSMWFEIGPLVTLEAFGAGVPVIAADIPNLNHQITDGVDGLLYRNGDHRDLADKLRSMVDSEGLRSKLRAGIKPVRTIDEEMQATASVYRRIVGESA